MSKRPEIPMFVVPDMHGHWTGHSGPSGYAVYLWAVTPGLFMVICCGAVDGLFLKGRVYPDLGNMPAWFIPAVVITSLLLLAVHITVIELINDRRFATDESGVPIEVRKARPILRWFSIASLTISDAFGLGMLQYVLAKMCFNPVP